jgi:F-type H+-transporting ATPase subunit gamma
VSQSLVGLRRKIAGAKDLLTVVRTMKAVAASSLGQYESSVECLKAYSAAVETGLGACLRRFGVPPGNPRPSTGGVVVVFGSDQGLVGRFNETVAALALGALATAKVRLWAVGDRVRDCLIDGGHPPLGCYPVPTSVQAIGPLVGEILVDAQDGAEGGTVGELVLFSNRPLGGALYEPIRQRVFPWEDDWCRGLSEQPWPGSNLPEILGTGWDTFQSLVRESLFLGLFRACAGSLASENAARLAAMQRAEKNIDDLVTLLGRSVQRLRQASIDEELLDVISGSNLLKS